jgi:Fur family peroxide stress response transcriptional regulator
MQTLKYSRQREAIKEFLAGRTDHPTADTVYSNIRQEFPNISLGTVYRNLSLLSDIGEILKISTSKGGDRFDGNTMPHYHFICTECNSVIDLEMKNLDHINELASVNFSGQIEGHVAHFYGKCEKCINKQ